MTDVTFRLADFASDADLAKVVALTDEYAQLEVAIGSALTPEVRDRLPAAMRAHPGLFAILAESESGDAIGLATCVLSWSSFRAAPLVNIHDLVVTASARNQGLGARLLEAVRIESVARGAAGVTLEVWPGNHAERLYVRSGYELSGHFYKRLNETPS